MTREKAPGQHMVPFGVCVCALWLAVAGCHAVSDEKAMTCVRCGSVVLVAAHGGVI